MISIICWKWGNKIQKKKKIIYSSDHVNILFNMVQRNTKNLNEEYEFVCITDNPQGINKDIRIIPLKSELIKYDGFFVKLEIYKENFIDILNNDRFIAIDLDALIVNDISSLINRTEPFIIWGEHWRSEPYCTALQMMNCGCRSNVWDTFKIEDYIKDDEINGLDQTHVNKILYPNEYMWTTKDGIYNFRSDIMKVTEFKRRINNGYEKIFNGDGTIPDNAKIIFFNGHYDPSQVDLQKEYPWIKEYWR